MLARRVLVALAIGAALLLGLAVAGGLRTPDREDVPVIDLDRPPAPDRATTSSTAAGSTPPPP